MSHRMSVGEVMLIPQGEWKFHVTGGVAVGRRLPVGGVMRIRSQFHNSDGVTSTHEACMGLASRVSRCATLTPFDVVQIATASGPFGSASYKRGRDFIRVWYCWRPAGVILGAYSCAWARHMERDYRNSMRECESMMLSAVFNRPSWGGKDPLTRSMEDVYPPPDDDLEGMHGTVRP